MLRRFTSMTLSLLLAGLAQAAEQLDSLTGLPVPDAASGILFDSPMKVGPTQICKSTQTVQFYTGATGSKVSAALAWYGAHLKGFHHLHGYWAGRTQDVFVNADGTLDVGIAGSPGADGVDSEVYAITYATLKPGMSDSVLKGVLSQHVTC